MLYIEGEPVLGLSEGATHTVYGSDTVRGTARFIYNTDELANFTPPDDELVLIIGMENAHFRYEAQKRMAVLEPSSIITLGVPSNHEVYVNATHLDVYLGYRAGQGNFLGLAVSKVFPMLDEEGPHRSDVGNWISERINGRLVEVSYVDPNVHISLI